MIQLAGLVVVLVVVFGGLMLSGGPAIMAALPFELALIGGAAVGTLLIANAPSVTKAAIAGLGASVRGAKWSKADYSALLITLHELSRRARRGGLIAIEADIETPRGSRLFGANPALLADSSALNLICDSFRLIALDPSTLDRTDERLRENVGDIIAERHKAVGALHTLADALPALGIVAAVLGIIKTMGVIDQSPAVLGEMIAAALLGTFLGVFLAYGLVGPMASRFAQIVEEEAFYLETIRSMISSYASGIAPRTAVELARSALPETIRPDIQTVDTALSAARFDQARQVA